MQELIAHRNTVLDSCLHAAPFGLLLQDPYALKQYMDSNIFLPDINNEKQHKDQRYADNLASLDQLVLYRFANDTTGGACTSMVQQQRACSGWTAEDCGQLVSLQLTVAWGAV